MPDFTHHIQFNGQYIAFINGRNCTALPDFYDAIAKALQLPEYFGKNLDALDEMLCDLSWIAESTVLLVILHADEMLRDAPEATGAIQDIFAHAAEELDSRGVLFSVFQQR